MHYTVELVRGWIGRDALDAEGTLLGTVAEAYADQVTGRPTWLGIRLAEEADDPGRAAGAGSQPGGVTPVPIDDAEPTGSAIRVAALAEAVRAAPRFAAGRTLEIGDEDALAAHYGLSEPETAATPDPAPQVDPARQGEVVELLQEAFALEAEGMLRLQTLIAGVEDPEVSHDATLHLDQTQLHRSGVEERLKALDASPSALEQVAHAAQAAVAGLKEKLEGDAVAAVRDAVEFERREADFYARLEALARAAGDTATADLASAHAADEAAAADVFAGSIPRLDSPV